ncbi:MAG: hypothetical protein ACRBBO_02920 [Cognatishimia sp.]|uniref:hypothetical protein n=1 Tax=Cognatishimia sp. 1_MG-2023 TaxID=3062642 RepID=UPI0026E1E31A|nr:hypothetical protein [Cognatishimia sp. 1_MG-2023]MDO6728165.1 hypothetical protein [Cognatishimia sp. 1_MG-2023]
MKLIPYTAIILFGGLSLATVATSETLQRGERPTDKIAADLNIPEQVFVTCFSDVQPARNHAPSGERQRMNKAVLLPCLQAENPTITNDMLDSVMDRYRPEGPMRG